MKVTHYRTLGLAMKPAGIGWALLETTPPPEKLRRVPIGDEDPIEVMVKRAQRARRENGMTSVFLYRYTEKLFNRAAFGGRFTGMTFHEHTALLRKAEVALRAEGFTVEYEDVA